MTASLSSSKSTQAEEGCTIPQGLTLITDYLEQGPQQSISPFLKLESRRWDANLTLKAATIAAMLLALAFATSFSPTLTPLSNLLLMTVYFLAGIPSLIEATEDLLDGEINIDILMTLAAFSSVFIGSGLEGGLLLVLFALSGAMEDAVTAKAKSTLTSLHKLSPSKACVIERDGTLIERAIRDIAVGARILVKAGQIVPLDGKVVEGASSVNLVHITGENLPVSRALGDEVPAGGRNLEGALVLEVTRSSADSTIAHIIQLVTQAQESRPRLQRWFDSMSRTYAITIMALAGLFALTFPYILSIPFLGVEGSLYRALTFLIAASPCALIIAIPIAYLSALSACARQGILLKGGISLDALARCKAVAFDKTGTLTTGELQCLSIEKLNLPTPAHSNDINIDTTTALAIAFSLEKNAIHPIANAISRQAETKGLPSIKLIEFKSLPGQGLQAQALLPWGHESVWIGRVSFIAAKLPYQLQQILQERARELEEQGELLAVLCVGRQPFIFRFSDTPRSAIANTLQAVKKRGWEIVMLTGDHQASAGRIASELGITEYHADLTPEDKLHYVTTLSQRKGLAMIGDGINDAPALARATVGICMGKVGSTAAIDAADIVLLQDNIENLDWLIGKAKMTQSIVKQNLILALGAIVVASLPALAGVIPLWLAVVMHEGGTVLVGLNALRLLKP